MAVSAVAFIMYPVTDMERSVAFYADVLGLTKSGVETSFWVEFEIAGATFGIGTFEQVGKAGTAQSLALETPDMAAFRATLAEHGVESSTPFETQICYISGLHDPTAIRSGCTNPSRVENSSDPHFETWTHERGRDVMLAYGSHARAT